MPTKPEAILLAFMEALGPHSATVLRETELPSECPEAGLINVVPADPKEGEEHLGGNVREWWREIELEAVVQNVDEAARAADLDAVIIELGALLHGERLGGLIDHLQIGSPVEGDDVPMDGAASLKGAVLPITIFYETTSNPTENYP
jgi:hypothetical protein